MFERPRAPSRAAHNGGGGMSVALRRVDVLGLWVFGFWMFDGGLGSGVVGFGGVLGLFGFRGKCSRRRKPDGCPVGNVEILRVDVFDCGFCVVRV